MAALVKFLRPTGEEVYINADRVTMVMPAPAGRATLHLAPAGFGSMIEVDVTPEAAAEALNSAAPGFVITNSYGSAEVPPEAVGEDQTPLNAT